MIRTIKRFTLDRLDFFLQWWINKWNADKNYLISQVLIKHVAWFPVHNQGQKAPDDAKKAWSLKLRVLSKKNLIGLIADNHARNLFLGKKWPPTGNQ